MQILKLLTLNLRQKSCLKHCYRNLQTSTAIPSPHRKFPILLQCAIKPKVVTQESQQTTCHLTPWGISLLAISYMQMGFLYKKPPHLGSQAIADHLKESLSHILTQFFPLSGLLETQIGGGNPPSYSISINCIDSPGAEFKYAVADDITLADITSSPDNILVESMFPFQGDINKDGHRLPLLAVQVTELVDGIFISCAINHSISDGTGFFYFIKKWSEMSFRMLMNKNERCEHVVSRPPIIKNWVMMSNHNSSIINIPFDYYNETIQNKAPPPQPPLHGRVFQFSAKSIAQLKAQATAECGNNISSLQSFCAFLWKCITRARQLPDNLETSCVLAASDRQRVQPNIPQEQFGCYITTLVATTTVGELLTNNLGRSAGVLQNVVGGHTVAKVHKHLEDWLKNPTDPLLFIENGMVVESSPRFQVYENDFGWGEPVVVRSGDGNKPDRAVFVHQGRDGPGNFEIELFLSPSIMNTLLSDPKFTDVVSPSPFE